MYDHGKAAEYWNTRADSFDAQYDALDVRQRVTRRIVELLGPRPGDRCLDLGVGTARMFRDHAGVFRPCERLIGVDFSPAMLDIATRHCANAGLVHFQPVQATFMDVPLPGCQADCISSSLALHHVPDDQKRAALAEAKRLARPGCRLVIADQMNCTGKPLSEPAFTALMLDTFFPGSSAARSAKSQAGHREYSCTLATMQQLFRDAGLSPTAEKINDVIGIVHAVLPA